MTRRKRKKSQKKPQPTPGDRNTPPQTAGTPEGKIDRPSSPPPPVSRWQRLLPLIIVLAAVVVYANSFGGGFVLDDDQNIEDNRRIRSLSNISNILATRRPLVELSLAVNYAIGELNPSGYHLFNLIIHILAGLTLYGIIRRTLLLPRFGKKYGASAHWFALSITLLWVVHPLQTESVTYVIQRGESMMGLFYLLTLYCLIRGSQALPRHRKYWYCGAAMATGLGMSCKAIIITAPAVLILYDRIFLSPSVKETIRRRWLFYLGVSMVIVITGSQLGVIQTTVSGSLKQRSPKRTVALMGRAATPMEYYKTQPSVILNYFKLSLWPDDLCLDYKLFPVKDRERIALTAITLLALLAASGLLLWRWPPMGFLAASLFIILAPTSYYWRLELTFEHRMYLSLAALIALTVFALQHAADSIARKAKISKTIATAVMAVFVLTASSALSARTIVRNRDYKDRITMYRSVLAVRPENPRAQYNLANPLSRMSKDLRRQGKRDEADRLLVEAIGHYEEAIRLFPDYTDARVNLALRYEEQKKMDAAVAMLHSALEINPRHGIALYNLGRVYFNQALLKQRQRKNTEALGAYENAAKYYRLSLKKRPRHAGSMIGLGESLRRLKKYKQAEPHLRKYLQYNPKNAHAMRALGDVLIRLGKPVEAEKWIKKSLKIDPNNKWGKRLLQETGKG